jgi:DNA polymerase-3 subunit gamma/tau
MGGTIMGVAPQSGGILPPGGGAPRSLEGTNAVSGLARSGEGGPAPAPPKPANERARGDETAEAPSEATSDLAMSAPNASATDEAAGDMAVGAPNASSTDPLAGTVAVPVVAEATSAPPPPSAPAPAAAAPAPALAGRSSGPAKTVPLPAVPSAEAAGEASAVDVAGDSPALVDLRGADTQPPRNRAVAPTAAIPRQSASTSRPESSSPSRIRPLDVILIVCTLGLYGIVLLFKQRKRPA